MAFEVALALINMVQVIALAWIARDAHKTRGEVQRINGELDELVRRPPSA